MAGASFRMQGLSGLSRLVGSAMTAMQQSESLMAACGETMVSSTVRRFETSTAPDGSDWEPAARGGQTLVDTGTLKKSIGYEASALAVALGTNVEYAAAHQFGVDPFTIRAKRAKALAWPGAAHPVARVDHPGLPARPFIGFSDEDLQELRALCRDHLAAACLAGAGGGRR